MKDEIPDFFWDVVKARFERMPSHLKLVIGGVGPLEKNDIIKHIEQRDEIGKILVKTQLNYLRIIAEEAESYEEAFDNTP
ncbi:MAG: hypothetical protein QXF12_04970 [Candidatus Aenigmatarchaeota archaeon]